MGLFSKKSTRVEKVNEKTTQTKIVKLSYLESLAINSGVTTAESLTETESSSEKITDSKTLKDRKIGKDLQKAAIGILGPIGKVLGAIGNALFGKKVTKDINLDISDSGYVVEKIWNEPQFDVIRYSIGIRDLAIAQFRYEQVSEIVSKPWTSPKEISKITLVVDQFIPSQFPPGETYIDYYIKPDSEDSEWTRINALDIPTVYEKGGNIVPRIITFNSEKPTNARLEEGFISTTAPIRSIRFKAVLKRPANIEGADSYTPILRNYRLLITPVGGL